MEEREDDGEDEEGLRNGGMSMSKVLKNNSERTDPSCKAIVPKVGKLDRSDWWEGKWCKLGRP